MVLSVGTNLSRLYAEGVGGWDLTFLQAAGADFVEIWPQNFGVIWGVAWIRPGYGWSGKMLEADLAYTVHAPLEINLMDLTSHDLQRDVLDASLRFAHAIGAEVVVCHAGQRVAARDARNSMRDQLGREVRLCGRREIWRQNCDHENYYPSSRSCAARSTTTRSGLPSWRSRSPGRPSRGRRLMRTCGLAARVFGFDYIGECTALAPLVRHVHLHDNLQRTNLRASPPSSSTPCTGWEICTSRRAGAPSARGPVAADELSRKPLVLRRTIPRALPPGSGSPRRHQRTNPEGSVQSGCPPEPQAGISAGCSGPRASWRCGNQVVTERAESWWEAIRFSKSRRLMVRRMHTRAASRHRASRSAPV